MKRDTHICLTCDGEGEIERRCGALHLHCDGETHVSWPECKACQGTGAAPCEVCDDEPGTVPYFGKYLCAYCVEDMEQDHLPQEERGVYADD